MSTSKKPTAREELERIEDALIGSILKTSGEELRKEIAATGIDPDSYITDVETTIAMAKAESTRKNLEKIRNELEAWRKRDVKESGATMDAARVKLDQMRSGDPDLNRKMMLAARNGEGLSESDLEGLLEDLTALEELDRVDEDK